MKNPLNEDTLVQATTADYLQAKLGWNSVYAYNTETFGVEGTLGRLSDKDIILTRYLSEALVKLNPGLPNAAYQDALRQMSEAPVTENMLQINYEQYERIKNGVLVQFRNNKGELEKKRLKVFDFDTPENNHFLCVRELWVRGDIYRRRADIVGFLNGLPLLFIECKTIHKDIRHAYEKNFSDYKDTIPHLFHHNAFLILGNGVDTKIGSLSSKFEHFNDWKRLAENDPGIVDMETLLKGVCNKRDFLDLFENYILFDESKGKLVCIDKITCVRMQQIIHNQWQTKITELEKQLCSLADEQAIMDMTRKLEWMRSTIMAVVVSEEQGEVDKFRKWGLDITPHRKLIKEGFETPDGKRIDIESAFKKAEHPFRVSIVCAMWLTGFDVPTLSTLYLDQHHL